VNIVINNMHNKFNQNPDFRISCIEICPEPNTIALGGVAIGNINAQLAEIAAGIINKQYFSKKYSIS